MLKPHVLAAGIALLAFAACADQQRDQRLAQPATQVAQPEAAPAAPAPPAPANAQTPAITTQPAPPAGTVVTAPARQIPLGPGGDPRTPEQRMEDVAAWDKCVSAAQTVIEDPGSKYPVSDTPEDLCRKRLGMNSRLDIPNKRR